MNWITFIVFAYIALVLEVSCRGAFAIYSLGGVTPSFIMPMFVAIALAAPRFHVMWAAIILGLAIDLSSPFAQSNGTELFVPGPHALGLAITGWLITQVRSSVFRDRVITIASMTFCAVLLSGILVLLLYRLRAAFPDAGSYFMTGSMTGDVVRTVGNAVYSALIAVPLGWLMLRTQPMWGFVQHMPRIGSAVR